MLRLLLVLPLLTIACDSGTGACTEIGCTSSITLTITDANEDAVTDLAGTVTFGDHTFNVDCAKGANNDEQVTCEDGVITILVRHPATDQEIAVDMSNADGMTCTAEGVVPEWTTDYPNGEDCPPVCMNTDFALAIDDV